MQLWKKKSKQAGEIAHRKDQQYIVSEKKHNLNT